MSYQCIRLRVEDFVAIVTLDNPPRNAMSIDMMNELVDVFDQMNDRDDVRVVVLTGEGKAFSAGADLKKRAAADQVAQPGDRWRRARIAREKNYVVLECMKPVIAAVNGAALGGGLGLATMADIIVASDQGSFGLPEIDVGLAGGARHAMRIFPHSLVRRMALTGYRVSGVASSRPACRPSS
jgi:enoyl-CoA hydratase